MNTEKIARTLIELRGKRSQEEVAKAYGVSVSAVKMYESGKRVPRDEIKVKIANFYKKTIESIFFA